MIENRSKGEKPVQAINQADALYRQAIETLPDYEREMNGFLESLRHAHPGQFESVEFMLAPLKKLSRFEAKVTGDYNNNANQVRDIVRGTFISDNVDDLPRIQDALEERFSVLLVKDNIFEPTDMGFRNYNNNILMPNGHIVETQVMPSQVWSVKHKSHALMEEAQKIERGVVDVENPKQAVAAIDKEGRILQNAAVYDTGMNAHLNPDLTAQQRARFVVPFEASKEFGLAADPTSYVTYGFNKAASPFLKKTAMVVLGAIPIIGMLPNTVEAKELEDKLQAAIDEGQVSKGALLEYQVVLTGHIAQGADPTVVMGEAGVQASFDDWADRYNVQGDLRESLQPSSLGLMMADGSVYIAQNIDRLPQATLDVGGFIGEQSLAGAEYVIDAADGAYDYMSGNAAHMQDLYDRLPVLDSAANDELYNPLDSDPISQYPLAHDLALIKTSIVDTQQMIDALNKGEKQPLGSMDIAESIDFLQQRIDRLNERFERNYDDVKLQGLLGEVEAYTAQYSAFNPEQDTPTLAIQDVDVAGALPVNLPKVSGI